MLDEFIYIQDRRLQEEDRQKPTGSNEWQAAHRAHDARREGPAAQLAHTQNIYKYTHVHDVSIYIYTYIHMYIYTHNGYIYVHLYIYI